MIVVETVLAYIGVFWRESLQLSDLVLYFLICSLSSVSAFRAEILRKTTFNAFKQQEQQQKKKVHAIKKVKGQEIFPQNFRRVQLKERHKEARFKTQPVTSHELNTIPESNLASYNGNKQLQVSQVIGAFTQKEEIRERVKPIAALVSAQPETDQPAPAASAPAVSAPAVVAGSLQKTQQSVESLRKHQPRLAPPKVDIQKAQPQSVRQQPPTPELPTPDPQFVDEGSDDEFDKLVAINYKELTQRDYSGLKEPELQKKQSQPQPQQQTAPAPIRTTPIAIIQAQQTDAEKQEEEQMKKKKYLQKAKAASVQPQESTETETEDEFSKMSIAQKMSMFKQLDKSSPLMMPQRPKRFLDKRKRMDARSRTQPITGEEVHEAAGKAQAEAQAVDPPREATPPRKPQPDKPREMTPPLPTPAVAGLARKFGTVRASPERETERRDAQPENKEEEEEQDALSK